MAAFNDWKQRLLDSAGSVAAAAPVRRLGDFVLELFWKDGCEPTMSGLLEYAEAGLCRRYNIVASATRPSFLSPSPSPPSPSEPASASERSASEF